MSAPGFHCAPAARQQTGVTDIDAVGPVCRRLASTHLRELVSHHVANPPGLVLGSLAQGGHDQGLQVLLRQQSGDADAGLHCQQPNRVLAEGAGFVSGVVASRGRVSSSL